MTVTSPIRAAARSRFRWVPTAAGWTVGVIATLSLLASISPLVRSVIKVPREFVNDYIINFPDTSFAWAFVLAVLAGALAARAARGHRHASVDGFGGAADARHPDDAIALCEDLAHGSRWAAHKARRLAQPR